MEQVSPMAAELHDLRAMFEFDQADTAFLIFPYGISHFANDGFSKSSGKSCDLGLVHGWFGGLHCCLLLSLNDSELSIPCYFIQHSGMIVKVIVDVKLVLDEVKWNNAIFELIVIIHFTAFVAAASENRVDQEDWKASNDENNVL